MKKLSKVLLVFCILFLAIYTFISPNAKTNAKTLGELKNELASLRSKKAQKDNEKKLTQGQIASSNQSILNARNEINVNQGKVEQAKEDIVVLNKDIDDTKESIKKTMSTYQLTDGSNVYLEYVFDAKSYEDLVYRYAIVEQIIDYNNEQIDKYNDLIEKNEQLQVDLANREVELNKQIDELGNKIESLGDKLEQISEDTMDVQDEINSTQELINYYKNLGCKDDQDLNECVSIKGDTGYMRPLNRGVITSYYGYRTNPLSGSGTKFHSGIDIGGNSEGTNVYATANGMVGKIIRKASCGGNQVYVFHTINGKQVTSMYMHLLTINVSLGDQVTSGTVVGTVGGGRGTSGWERCSTGAHLHFTLANGWYGKTYLTYGTFLANTYDPQKTLGLPNKGIYWSGR